MTHLSHLSSSSRPVASHPSSHRRSLIASSLGNLLEWFDWTVYTVASVYIAGALFDNTNKTSSLLGTLAVFAAGFFARPLGGIVFGAIANRIGRRSVLLSTMFLMAFASLLIAIIPPYDAIGSWASAALLVARLVQGAAHGGETTASYAYVAEIAPPAQRGLWSSAVFISVGAGSLIATFFLRRSRRSFHRTPCRTGDGGCRSRRAGFSRYSRYGCAAIWWKASALTPRPRPVTSRGRGPRSCAKA
ncbi:MFS transporter [Burkholderia cepacia]|uniref:MFS transporter n=1 Tax=Burkholderia cepacia TaxID=292 RepID=UPI00298FA81D|nr:MFS transporter [Burkholderia cepacia]